MVSLCQSERNDIVEFQSTNTASGVSPVWNSGKLFDVKDTEVGIHLEMAQSWQNVTSSVPLTLGHFVTTKWLILECIFAENQNYYPITDLISGRHPMSTAISAYHSAHIIRELQQIY